MHHIVLERKLGHNNFKYTHHINRNKSDNRKENLQAATHQQNQCSRSKFKNNTSGYIGVTWHKSHGKWMARIQVDRKRIHLGYFDDEIMAARAHDLAAIKYHGEFAVLNFPRSN